MRVGVAARAGFIPQGDGAVKRELDRIALAPASAPAINTAMRRSKEIIVLLALLAGAMAFVLWYVIDRRAKNRATAVPALTTPPAGPAPVVPPAVTKSTGATPVSGPVTVLPDPQSVALGTATTERKTVDFSDGRAVVKDSVEDRTAIDAAMKDIAEASQSVSFDDPPKKPAAPTPAK
jgi:hypothetical protein